MRTTTPSAVVSRTVDRRRAASGVARVAVVLAVAAMGVVAPQRGGAAEPISLERLALCQDSWYDWKDDKVRVTQFVAAMKSRLKTGDEGQSYKPIAPMALFGVPVLQVYPQSIGMGVGFSVLLDVDLATARRIFEKQLGHPMRCEKSDGMESCGLSIAEERTATLTANIRPDKPTLAGCYYFYQQ